MTIDEARALMHHNPKNRPTVVVKRNGATWRGQVTGIIGEPAMILETENGNRIPIVLEGTRAKAEDRA